MNFYLTKENVPNKYFTGSYNEQILKTLNYNNIKYIYFFRKKF